MQRKNTMEAVNSASSVVRTSGTDAANTGEVTLVKNEDYQVLIEDMGNEAHHTIAIPGGASVR